MDVDFMNLSSPQNHLEMMEMMIQLNKHPQIPRAYQNFSDSSSEIEFSGGSASSTETPPTIFHSPFLNTSSSSISFMGTPIQEPSKVVVSNFANVDEISFPSSIQKKNSMEAMREVIFRIAMMQPIHIDQESVKPPKRKNVKISKDPQSVAARHRRERISEKIRILQRLVPGGTKMDTASMLDEAVHYVKFLKKQVQSLEKAAANRPLMVAGFPTAASSSTAMNYSRLEKACLPAHMVGSMPMLS